MWNTGCSCIWPDVKLLLLLHLTRCETPSGQYTCSSCMWLHEEQLLLLHLASAEQLLLMQLATCRTTTAFAFDQRLFLYLVRGKAAPLASGPNCSSCCSCIRLHFGQLLLLQLSYDSLLSSSAAVCVRLHISSCTNLQQAVQKGNPSIFLYDASNMDGICL
jgi:hypothetical protein